MFNRTLNPLKTNSFFLFGARGTGKSTLIRNIFQGIPTLEIDLLNPLQFEQATLGLSELLARINSALDQNQWIFIDEVQKSPKLLDYVQSMIDQRGAKFILSGSSARKLKRGGANLLAGRAFTYNLHPLTRQELAGSFDLNTHLAFGGLPRVWNTASVEERILFIRSYVTTYLKEEIAEEQIVRKLEPFAKFLQVAGQSSGKIVNYSSIAGDVGVSDQTIKSYFQILEDTLLGFFIPAFNESIRKSQGKSPKFYFYDTGILRGLKRTIDQPLTESTYEYGDLFEHFIIQEIRRRAEYKGYDFEYSFLRLANNHEIDLIIDRPGKPRAIIEIKSTNSIQEKHTQTLFNLGSDIKNSELFLLSRDPNKKRFGTLRCFYWEEGINEILGE